jgi:hypothetical protein
MGVVPGTVAAEGDVLAGTGGSGGMGTGAFCWAKEAVPKKSELRRRKRTGSGVMNREWFE